MAPEYPPELVIFDSRFEDNKLKGDLHYVEVPPGERLRVRWDAEIEPEGFQSVGGGVAYVFKTDQLQLLPISHDSIPDDLGNLRYRWSEGLNLGIPWVMFILILPRGHTLADAEPMPARPKIFKDRLALYWILRADDLGRTQVECTLKTFQGSASSKLVDLNRFCSGESPPRDGSIQIEDSSLSSSKRVFISYSHDSDAHREQVLALSERLRADGIETLLDQYVNGAPPQGWPRWMLDQLDVADSVLVVCTETYYRRFRGHEEPGKGRGVDWEGALITSELYEARSRTVKFVPILLSAAGEKWIPEPLRSGTRFALTSEEDYENLYDFLLEQAGVEPHPVGTLKRKSRRKGIALTFGQPSWLGDARKLISPQEFVDDRILGAAEPSGAISLNLTRPIRPGDAQSGESPNQGNTRVFISYSADSPEHIERVRDFAARLKSDGIDARIDTDVNLDPPEGWPTYSQNEIEEADNVILICTETYRRRFDGREELDLGKGVTFEGRLIKQEIFESQGRTTKFIPAVLNLEDVIHIPSLLRDRGRYVVSQDTDSRSALGYRALLRRLSQTPSLAPSAAKGSLSPKPKQDTMPTHQFNAQRFKELEELLAIEYEKSHEFEKEISLSDGASRITLKQRFKRDVTPRLRTLEQEYAEMLVTRVPTGQMPEAQAEALVSDLSEVTNTILQSAPVNAPQEMIRLLGEIKTKLSEPKESASAKLKISLPLIPAICSYEMEIETAGLMKRVWRKARDFFKELLPK